MNTADFAERLRECLRELHPFTPDALSKFFGIPSRHFHQSEPDGPILFHPAGDLSEHSILLRGAIFWNGPGGQQIVRGHPLIFPTSDYCSERHQVLLEPILARAAANDGEIIAEPKLFGETIRVYNHGGDLYCATDVTHDGGNPLVGAGIENARTLGIDYGSQAARILSEKYPRVERLAKLGYVAVFVLQLPEMAPDHSVDRADMILVDVVDPDMLFVDRLEKERIAEDFALTVVGPASQITVNSADPSALLRRLRALEHQLNQPASAGFIVKGRLDESSDQLFCKVEPSSERDRSRQVSGADLTTITEEIAGQFGDNIWLDDRVAEELMLEYLSTHHRTARWRVNEYLTSWKSARQLAGLG
jgi:hypothetical protein